jgi:hypothetical protein
MKPSSYFPTLLAGLTLLTFIHCSKENDPEHGTNVLSPGEQVLQAFDDRYPGATGVVWSLESGYYVADFILNQQQASAWFGANGDWRLGKITASYQQIEPIVAKSLSHTSYASWEVKETYILNRKDLVPVYIVGMTNNQILSNLYFTRNGDFIKVIDDAGSRTDVPIVIPAALALAINMLFDDKIEIADIYVIDVINSEISVGIIKDETYATAIFDKNYVWIINLWNLTEETVPSVVMKGFRSSPYASLTLSRIRSMQDAATTTYLFYLVKNNKTMIAQFTSDGRLSTVISRDHVMAKYLLNI